jgi:type II secretory pathway pseudopilin PulG
MFNTRSKKYAGFGLIELLVSISVIMLVMGVVMARHSSYNGAVLLRSQAYEVALLLREVQLSAVSAVGQGSNYRNVYGVYFNEGSNFYYTFSDDTPNNYFYNDGEELGKRNNLDERFVISDIRTVDGGVDSPVPGDDISIVFQRPNFDALFYTDEDDAVLTGVSTVEIDVRLVGTTGNGVGEVRTVEVSRTGQITVQ